LTVSKGSAGEVQAYSYFARDAGYISDTQFDELAQLSLRVSSLLGGTLRSIKSRERQQAGLGRGRLR